MVRFQSRHRNTKRGLIGLALVAVAWASPAQAHPLDWAYLWADQPTSASYTPSLHYQSNSSGGTNTVTRNGVGYYTAFLPGLVSVGGVVHVTAYGGGPETCKVSSWGPDDPYQLVNVRCFAASGAPVDTRFTLSYANPVTPDAVMAYLWANQPTAASYTPSTINQFNSAGGLNTITRTAVGSYTAALPGLAVIAGHVQVTAYGSGSERCKVYNWGPNLLDASDTTQYVRVKCFDSSGADVDSRFTLTYVEGNSIVGGSSCCFPDPGPSGSYLWAHRATATTYTPSLAYQWNDLLHTDDVVTRLGAGDYTVQFAGHSLNVTTGIQVTAHGSTPDYCKIVFWTTEDGANVRCFNAAGQPIDARFTIALLDHWQGL